MTASGFVQPEQCCLHLIDLQESLMRQVHASERVIRVVECMIDCAEILDIPILANTQYKKGLGPYVERLEKRVKNLPRPDKVEFGAYENSETCDVLDSFSGDISTVILVGIETHVCIYQSAMGVLARGMTPWIVADGVSSRSRANHELGLARLRQIGAAVGPAEMIIYELLGKAGTQEFKNVLPHIIALGSDDSK